MEVQNKQNLKPWTKVRSSLGSGFQSLDPKEKSDSCKYKNFQRTNIFLIANPNIHKVGMNIPETRSKNSLALSYIFKAKRHASVYCRSKVWNLEPKFWTGLEQ